MEGLPPLGARVRYTGDDPEAEGAVGFVRKILPFYDQNRPHDLGPRDRWTVVIEFETFPRGWPRIAREFTTTPQHLELAPAVRRTFARPMLSAGRS